MSDVPHRYEIERYYWAHATGGVLCDTEEQARELLAKEGKQDVHLVKRSIPK